MIALNWSLSPSNGWPLRSSSWRPLQNFLNYYCTERSLAVPGPNVLLVLWVVSAALRLILNSNKKTAWICFLFNVIFICVCAYMHKCTLNHFSSVWLFAMLWTVVRQVPLSMGFSRQEYWSGLPCPPLGDLPDPGIEPISLKSTCIGKRVLYHYRHLGSPIPGSC